MALWVCENDGVRYAVGMPACPQCGSTEYREDGEEQVPDGAAADVLAWVGEDPERAALALTIEQDSTKPRTTLIDQLTKLAGQEVT